MAREVSRDEIAAVLEQLAATAREIKQMTDDYLQQLSGPPNDDGSAEVDMSRLDALAKRAHALVERHRMLAARQEKESQTRHESA